MICNIKCGKVYAPDHLVQRIRGRVRLAVDVLVAEAQAEDASRGSRKAAREVGQV